MRRGAAILAVACGFVIGCSSSQPDESPTGALRAFLSAMDESREDGRALEQACKLLDRTTRERLEERARLATALADGRDFKPWEMLAQGRFRMRFSPKRQGAMHETVTGERAVVRVTGESGDHAEVPLVREAGRWRVVLDIPATQRR